MEIRELEDKIRDLEVQIKWKSCIHGLALEVRAMRAQVRGYEAQIKAIKNEHIEKEQKANRELVDGIAELKRLVGAYEKI